MNRGSIDRVIINRSLDRGEKDLDAASRRLVKTGRSATRVLIIFIGAMITTGLMLASSCSPRVDAQRYELKGKVVSVDTRCATVTIAHDAIPGYRAAMIMPFSLKASRLLKALAEGDSIQATLVVAGPRTWLEDVIATRSSAIDPSAVGGNNPEPEPGAQVPD